MNFIMKLPQSANQKSNNYNLILIIIDSLIKIIYYKLVQMIITIPILIEVIFNIIVEYYGLLNPIIRNYNLIFISKFQFSLFYFLSIKQKVFTSFYLYIYNQTEWQNRIIEIYLRVFINYKQNNEVKLLSIVELTYNNTKNTSIRCISFKLNCRYYLYIFYKKDNDFCFRFKIVDKLPKKLKNLITAYRKNF